MKTLLSIVTLFTCIGISTISFAASIQPYVGINGGIMITDDTGLRNSAGEPAGLSYETGYSVSGTAGLILPVSADCNLRPELEFAYKSSKFNEIKIQGLKAPINGDAWLIAGMANIYFDINTGTPITPYVGGGVGVASLNVSEARVSGVLVWTKSDDTTLAYQGGVGVKYDVNKSLGFDVGYKYFATNESDFGLIKGDFQAHNLQAGVLFKF